MKTQALIEQFLLKGENGSGSDRLYRQSKTPSLMLIRLKIMVNHCQDFQKGVETGNYLVSLGTPSESTLDDNVQRYLGLESRRGFNLYLSGVSWLIYAENSHSGE